MEFEWDEAKSRRNVALRQLPFQLAITMFDGETLEIVDTRIDYGELRIKAIGMVRDEFFVCIYVDRDQVRRIISLRLANRRERDEYRQAIET
jgi:uncharacterized DUF497 family protein